MTLTALASPHTTGPSSFTAAMEHVAQGFEALGALILVAGVIWSVVLGVVAWRRSGSGPPPGVFSVSRDLLGHEGNPGSVR